MLGTKATAIDTYAAESGLGATRFDYSGHGESGGDFETATISRWLAESLEIFETETTGPQIVIGSSMGAWIALLMNRELRRRGDSRVIGMVLIAPAVDMTETLILPGLTVSERERMQRDGRIGEGVELMTWALIEDGSKHNLFGAPLETGCPVTILQGTADESVPATHAIRLMSHLPSDEATLTLVPGGDHRLSRPEDLRLLTDTIGRMIAETKTAL
jgi:alpha-beta hydrolase superfamily lysophospholipase